MRSCRASRYAALTGAALVLGSPSGAAACNFWQQVDFAKMEKDQPDFRSDPGFQSAKKIITAMTDSQLWCRISDVEPDFQGVEGDYAAQEGRLSGTWNQIPIKDAYDLHGSPLTDRWTGAIKGGCLALAYYYKIAAPAECPDAPQPIIHDRTPVPKPQ